MIVFFMDGKQLMLQKPERTNEHSDCRSGELWEINVDKFHICIRWSSQPILQQFLRGFLHKVRNLLGDITVHSTTFF